MLHSELKQSKTSLLNIRESPKGSCCLLMATAEQNLQKFRYGNRNLLEAAHIQEVEETVFHLPHHVLLVKKEVLVPRKENLTNCVKEKRNRHHLHTIPCFQNVRRPIQLAYRKIFTRKYDHCQMRILNQIFSEK